MNTVLTCLDHSIYTQSVLDHAIWAATRLGAGMELMHTLDRHPEHAVTANLSGSIGLGSNEALLQELAALDEQRSKLALERGRALLDEAVRQARAQGVEPAHPRLRHGDLVDALAELESGFDLLVMGKRGEAADMAKLHLGSNVERVARAIDRPMLVASRAFKPIERVLIAFDGSPSARKAVELAARHPLLAGLQCHVVMAASESAESKAAMHWAVQLLDAAGVEARMETIPGHADAVIADYVRTHAIDLVAMGAYGHSRIRQLIVGSTTTTMIRSCLVPILLLR
ncbi:universal stress protein [Dyella sp. KULCS107]|uniref:universal stress protein n=1 Tax=Dyella sp. KULCS107 TaxID=3422216 RepID=UPI003D6ED668